MALLVSQRLDWVEASCFEGGEQAGNYSYGRAECDGNQHCSCRDHRGVGDWANRFENLHKPIGSCHPQGGAKQRDDDAFDEYLCKDGEPGGAYGFANPNFPDPFVNAREHDVHNANAAYQQTDRRDNPSAHPGVVNLLVDAFQLVFLRPKPEIFNPVVSQHQNIAGLLECWFQVVQVGNLQVDITQAIIRSPIIDTGSAETHPGCI